MQQRTEIEVQVKAGLLIDGQAKLEMSQSRRDRFKQDCQLQDLKAELLKVVKDILLTDQGFIKLHKFLTQVEADISTI